MISCHLIAFFKIPFKILKLVYLGREDPNPAQNRGASEIRKEEGVSVGDSGWPLEVNWRDSGLRVGDGWGAEPPGRCSRASQCPCREPAGQTTSESLSSLRSFAGAVPSSCVTVLSGRRSHSWVLSLSDHLMHRGTPSDILPDTSVYFLQSSYLFVIRHYSPPQMTSPGGEELCLI